MKLIFNVDGNPVPKQSYRHSKNGGYTPARVKAWQETVAWKARSAVACANAPMIDGPCNVSLVFRLNHKRRVDLDNLSKAVLDGCNGIIWTDDKWVTELHLRKRQDDNPGVSVWVECENIG